MRYITPSFQDYNWGSKDFIQDLLSLPKTRIIAEAWYGAHPKAPATIDGVSLAELVHRDPEFWLGPRCKDFPYLMKILAAEQALSIQVHPIKKQAEQGFARENSQQIPLDSPQRNYRDPNHKPELLLALSKFSALCGFRDFEDMRNIILHYDLDRFFAKFSPFAKQPNPDTFLDFYHETISRSSLPGLSEHLAKLSPRPPYEQELRWAQKLLEQYPADRSIISPFLLNLIELTPYQAIYLETGIVHAYLGGAGIEIMAASDNVLRAGLTQKHMDTHELLKILKPNPYFPKLLSFTSVPDTWQSFPLEVQDFSLWRLELHHETAIPKIDGAKIILCLNGDALLKRQSQSLPIKRGASIIIPHSEKGVIAIGKAELIMAAPGCTAAFLN